MSHPQDMHAVFLHSNDKWLNASSNYLAGRAFGDGWYVVAVQSQTDASTVVQSHIVIPNSDLLRTGGRGREGVSI